VFSFYNQISSDVFEPVAGLPEVEGHVFAQVSYNQLHLWGAVENDFVLEILDSLLYIIEKPLQYHASFVRDKSNSVSSEI
jgi:hypothetical protein